MIFIIDDDQIMAECIARACSSSDDVEIYNNGIEAMQAIDQIGIPSLIFLDILLDGPDGFTLLNELMSYPDTAKIPIVLISSINFQGHDLTTYNIVGALSKETMMPSQIKEYAEQYHAWIH